MAKPPNHPSPARALLAPATLAAAVAAGGCALMNAANDPLGAIESIPGLVDSIVQIKTVGDIKRSFVFRAAELLFPNGLTESPDDLPVLTPQQQEQLSDFLSQRIGGIQQLAGRLLSQHPQYQSPDNAAPRFKRLKFLATGHPEAVVDEEGVVFIDVRITQAVLRSVIIHWQRSGGLEGSGGGIFSMFAGVRRGDFGPDAKPLTRDEEVAAIAQFNRFRAAIAQAAPNMDIGIWWKALTREPAESPFGRSKDDGPMDRMLDGMLDRMMNGFIEQLNEESALAAARYAQETFESSLDFLVAHELAHQVFRHGATRSQPGPVDAATCAAWRAQELQADEFAAVLLIQRQLAESTARTIVQKGEGSFEISGRGHQPSVDGRTLFLSTAYRLAGFNGVLGGSGCSYPTVHERIARLDPLFTYADAGRSAGLYYEGLLKGHWTRQRDDARLPDVLASADRSLPAADSPAAAARGRIVSLLQPLVQNRFKGQI